MSSAPLIPEQRQARVLAALRRDGIVSIRSLAEALDVSQQAVSLQLKRVRQILGDPLFVRTGHGMVPTAYGQLIQPHVRQLLTLIHAMPMPTLRGWWMFQNTSTIARKSGTP